MIVPEVPNSVAPPPIHDEAKFAAFYDRMKVTKRVFVFSTAAAPGNRPRNSKGAVEGDQCVVNANFFEDDDEAVAFVEANEVSNQAELTDAQKQRIRQDNAAQRKLWTDLCRMEFGQRHRKFSAKFPSTMSFYRYFLIPIAVVLALITIAWPVWNVLVDLEAEDHYRVLGIEGGATAAEIKKAYRAETKKWHPDLNPNCGDHCRHRMIQLQQAHDVLLSRGDRSEELKNKYREALSQIRSILVFRLYQISFHAAEFTNVLLLACIPALKPLKHIVRRSTRVGFILVFVALEVIFVTGLNPIVMIQVFYFCATMLRQSAALSDIQKISKWSYIDIRTDALVFVLPSILAHGFWYCFLSQSFSRSLGEYGWHAFVGASYLCAHLQRFSPNLWDNFALKKCSVTLEYLKQPQLQLSMWQVLLAEAGVLIDDVFAFSSHVPSPFRIAVFVVHSLYLTQFVLLPHDSPIKGKLRRKREAAADGNSPSPKEKLGATKSKDHINVAAATQKKTPLTEREVMWFADLDAEQVMWFDLVGVKYAPFLTRAANAPRKEPAKISMRCTSSGSELLICVDTASGTTVDARFPDTDAVKIVARETGPGALLDVPHHKMTKEMAQQRLHQLIPHSGLLSSQVYRRYLGRDGQRVLSPHGHVPRTLFGASLLLCSLLLACLVSMPLLDEVETLFDPLPAPSSPSKYRHALASGHLLNQGAGLLPLASGPLAVVVPDMIDTLRQMSLYSAEDTQAYAVAVKSKPTAKPHKRAEKGGVPNNQRRGRPRTA